GGYQLATGATGTATLSLSGNGQMVVGGGRSAFDNAGGSAVVNASGNSLLAVNGTDFIYFGDGAGSVGRLNVSGSSNVSIGQWAMIGVNGGEGHLNVSGGNVDIARLQGGHD